MPTPRQKLTTQRSDLATFVEFDLMNNRDGFIGYRVLPLMNVRYQADTFGRIPTEQLGKLADVTRTSSGGYNRIKFTFDEDSYATKEYGLEGPVDNRNARIYAELIDAYAATASLVMHNVLAQAELRVAKALFNSSTWSPSDVTNEWDDFAAATPIDDVMGASQGVRDKIGQYANSLVINMKVFRNLIRCDQIIERVAAFGAGDRVKPADITTDMLARCFSLEQVIVADSSYDTTMEGQTTVFSDIWDDEYASVCRIAMGNNMEEACVGRTFHWVGDGSQSGGRVETYYEEAVRGDVVRVRHETHEKIIYPEAAVLLGNITA